MQRSVTMEPLITRGQGRTNMDASISQVGGRAAGRGQLWAGRAISALPILGLALSGAMKLSHQAPIVENLAKFGYPETALTGLGLVELACAALYAIPRTRFLG